MTNTQRKKLADLIKGRTGTAAEIAAAVNGEFTLYSRNVTSRTLAAELGLTVAGLLLNKLDTAIAAADEPIKSALATAKSWLAPEAGGIDVGDPKTRTQIDLLASAGFSADELNLIKGLGERRELDFTATASDVTEAATLNERIAAQEQVHRDFTNDYQSRVAVADAVLARLNTGEVVDVVTEL